MPFNGDFIKRHAEAVSLYEDVQVIYVVRDINGDVTKGVLEVEFEKNKLKEKVIYYYIEPTGVSIIDKYLSEKKYKKLYKNAILNYIEKSGTPDLTHIHVGMKAGSVARWLKKTKNIPYAISEHWTGFLPEANEKITGLPIYIQSLWKKVMKEASGFSAVSRHLADALQKRFAIEQIRIIPNVVDTTIFYPAPVLQKSPRFIHISTLVEFKNPASIIKAFAIVRKDYPSAFLDIFGPENRQLMELVMALQLESNIFFHEEVPQLQLAEFIRQSAALILYSSYETFGCVIIEANACGVPVIVSNIPVLHEIVKEAVNGSFAKQDDSSALADTIITMIENMSTYDNAVIAKKTTSKYSYEVVGKEFSLWYSEIVKSD